MTTATHDRRTAGASFRDGEAERPAEYETSGRSLQDEGDGHQSGSKNAESLAKGLGWFSIGLGLAQLAAPRGMSRMIGVGDSDENRNTMLAVGLRELACGVGILTQPRPSGWVWSRVGGDAMDLVLLGRGLKSDNADRNRLGLATAAVLGVGLLDLMASKRLSAGEGNGGTARSQGQRSGSIHVHKTITIYRPIEEVYSFWRDFENLPRFMDHLESVRTTGDRRSHWKAKAPAGTTVEWEAEIVEDRTNELIVWRSVEKADVTNSGVVRFTPAPGGRATEIHVELRYDPPGGIIGATIAKLFGEEPSQQIAGDLRRFKQVMEVGEVVNSDASIHRGLHPAQPPAETPALATTTQGRMS